MRVAKRRCLIVGAITLCALVAGSIAWVTGWRGPWGWLTGEQAKQALLDLMATRDRGPVSRSDALRFADAPVKYTDFGRAKWGPFRLDLQSARYEFETTY